MKNRLTSTPNVELLPASRLLRFSAGLSLVGGVALLLIFLVPIGWARTWELDWYLFWVGTFISCVAIVLALIACTVRGADAAVGSALVLVGVDLVVILAVVFALFSFRMGAP